MRNPKPRGRAVQSAAPVARLRNFYVAFAVIAVLIVIGVVYNVYGSTAEAVKTLEATIPAPRVGDIPIGKTDDGRYYIGKPDAAVTVVEYADYQCPGCAFYANSLSAAFEKEFIATGDVRLIFQDFPLGMHVNAVHAAVAARCAGDQSVGAFWQYNSLLFINQTQWSDLETAAFKQQTVAYAGQRHLRHVLRCLRTNERSAISRRSLTGSGYQAHHLSLYKAKLWMQAVPKVSMISMHWCVRQSILHSANNHINGHTA